MFVIQYSPHGFRQNLTHTTGWHGLYPPASVRRNPLRCFYHAESD